MTAEREAAIRALHNLDLDALGLGWGGDNATRQRIDAIAYLSSLVGELRQERNRQATALDAVQALADRWDDGHTGTQRLFCPTCCEVNTLRAAVGLAGDVGAGRRGQAADQSQGPLRAAGGDVRDNGTTTEGTR